MIGETSAVVEACGGSVGQLTLPSSTISTGVGNLLLTEGWEKEGGEEGERRQRREQTSDNNNTPAFSRNSECV